MKTVFIALVVAGVLTLAGLGRLAGPATRICYLDLAQLSHLKPPLSWVGWGPARGPRRERL